jgi:hypothetical protein
LRQALSSDILTATTHENSVIAAAAADVLAALNQECSSTFVHAIRSAFDLWADRQLWCVRCKKQIAQRFCPKCRIGLDSPRRALLEQLIRCAAISASELALLTNDKDHDVAKIAKTGIASDAKPL